MNTTTTITPQHNQFNSSNKNIIDLSQIKNLNETTREVPMINDILKIVSSRGLNNGESYGPNRVLINKIAISKSKPK